MINVEAETEWDATVAAFCGGVLGTVAVLVHQLYVVLFGDDLIVDPFVYVMTEMAVLLPAGAMLFAGVAMIRNRYRLGNAIEVLPSDVVDGPTPVSFPIQPDPRK